MIRFWRAFKALLLIALGAGLAIGVGQCSKNTFPSHWFALQVDAEESPAMPDILAKESMDKFEKGYVLPKIVSLGGRAKFVPRGGYEAPLGYEVLLSLQSEEDMKRESEGRGVFPKWAFVKMRFVLRDKDGFEIATLKSAVDSKDWPYHVYTGRPKTIKGLTLEKVSVANASETKSVECMIELADMGTNGSD